MPTSEAVVLPANVRPSRYNVKLQPDLTRFTFQGEETIRIRVMEPASEVSPEPTSTVKCWRMQLGRVISRGMPT